MRGLKDTHITREEDPEERFQEGGFIVRKPLTQFVILIVNKKCHLCKY